MENAVGNHNKNSSFVKQAAILAGAGILVRVIGFLYRLPLTNMIGDKGNGIYGIGFSFYNFFLILSSAGLPVAISKMVSERNALGEYQNAHRVFRVSMMVAGILGLVCSLVLGFGAHWFANNLVGSPQSYFTLLTLSPTVFVVAIMAVFRGYFQGQKNSVPTALSQIVEQVFNAAFSLILAFLFMKAAVGAPEADAVAFGAAGGTAGTGVGALAGLLLIIGIYILSRPRIRKRMAGDHTKAKPESGKGIATELLKTALPIIAGTAIFSISNLIDTGMVMRRLEAGGFSTDAATELFGILNAKYVTITTLPVSISTALAIAAIPSVASSVVRKEKKAVNHKINSALRIAMLLSIPCAVGIGILASPILHLLFPNMPKGETVLQVGSISIIFLALAQIVTGMLQGIGQVKKPVIGAFCGALVKIPLNYVLIAIPQINVVGAVISTIACYAVASAIDWYYLTKATGIKPDMISIMIKPLASALVMGLGCYVFYYLFLYLTGRNAVATVLAIGIGVVIYFVYMLLLNGLREEDIRRFPMGGRIAAAFKKQGLLS